MCNVPNDNYQSYVWVNFHWNMHRRVLKWLAKHWRAGRHTTMISGDDYWEWLS